MCSNACPLYLWGNPGMQERAVEKRLTLENIASRSVPPTTVGALAHRSKYSVRALPASKRHLPASPNLFRCLASRLRAKGKASLLSTAFADNVGADRVPSIFGVMSPSSQRGVFGCSLLNRR
eukprot:15431808-Alexandrium_andersonii.AAC.1